MSFLYKSGEKLSVKNGSLNANGKIQEKIYAYLSSTLDFKFDLHNKDLEQIYKSLEERRGYSPFILEDYLLDYDEKFLETRTMVSFIEKEALIEDIYRRTNQDKRAIDLMLKDLSLKRMDEDQLINQTFSNDNRLFRTPLIHVNGYYLFSFNILLEASQYFRMRILKNELREGLDKKTKQLVQENYDESDLIALKKLLVRKGVVGEINSNLNKYSQCKNIFLENASIAQEVDFYFIKNDVLHLMELKNRDIDRSLHDVSKSSTVAINHMRKMSNRRDFFLRYRDVFNEIFGKEYNFVQLYLVNKYSHFLDNSFDSDYNVNIFSFDTFYKYIDDFL